MTTPIRTTKAGATRRKMKALRFSFSMAIRSFP
jgi:hypothetical protein